LRPINKKGTDVHKFNLSWIWHTRLQVFENRISERSSNLSYRKGCGQAVLYGLQVTASKEERTFCQGDLDDTDWEEEGIFKCIPAPVAMQGMWVFEIGAAYHKLNEETVDEELRPLCG